MKQRAALCLGLAAVLIPLAGCLPSPDAAVAVAESAPPGPAGFWKGLWHGFIVVFSFVISLFNDGVGVYQPHNTGSLYDLGFVLGVMCFFGGSGGGVCKSTRC